MSEPTTDNMEIVLDGPKAGTEQNPLGDAFNVTVSIPESVEITMVNASVLSDYEIWIFISSLLSNAMIGIWVAYWTNTNAAIDKLLWWNSVIFTLLFLITLGVAGYKRYSLSKKSRSIKLKTSKIEE